MLLVISSFVFAVPVFLFAKRRKTKHAVMFTALTCTSMLYHGKIYVNYVKYVDIPLAHMMMLGYTGHGMRRWLETSNINYLRGCIASTTGSILYIINKYILRNKDRRDFYHSLVQISGALAICHYINAS